MNNKILSELENYKYNTNEHSDSYNDRYYIMDEENFNSFSSQMKENYFELLSITCIENFESFKDVVLIYFFEFASIQDVLAIIVPISERKALSICSIYASASWYEREIQDGFGIAFINSFDNRRLILHEMYNEKFYPMVKSFVNGSIETKKVIIPEDEYKFNKIEGEGVYQIPVGPVHAGIIEPGHFRFSVIGETIYNLELRLFYKHRGIEKLAEGKDPLDVIKIAESISGDESIANSIAFCIAIEKIHKISLPKRVWQIRTVLLELERIYSFLSDLAGMVIDVAYSLGASGFFILREEIFRFNQTLTGSRFMKNMITIGGLKKDVSNESLEKLSKYLTDFIKQFTKYVKESLSLTTVIDRLVTTGIVKESLIRPLHLTGPIARAINNTKKDERVNHSYGVYKNKELDIIGDQNGDVLARFNVKQQEIVKSAKIIQMQIENLQEGHYQISVSKVTTGYATSIVEAPRGQNFHFVYVKNGKIDRYKVRTASYCNWQAIQHAVIGNIVPDFPLINKSFNLSYAGTDL